MADDPPALRNNWKRSLLLARGQRAMLIFLYLLVIVQLRVALAWVRGGPIGTVLPWAWFLLVWCIFIAMAFALHALYDDSPPTFHWLPLIAFPIAGAAVVLIFNALIATRFRDEFGLGGFWLGVSWKALRRQFDDAACKGCGYNLTGNQSGRCPECGRPTGLSTEDQALLARRMQNGD